MAEYQTTTRSTNESLLATHKVLRNTYMLLGLTLLFSAFTAFASMAVGLGHGVAMIMSFAAIGIVWFVLPRTENKPSGLVWTFVFTGLLGAGLGPMLNVYLAVMPGVVFQALAGTAVIFFTLSAYTLITRSDFSFMGGALMVGIVVAFVISILGLVFQMPMMNLVASGLFMLVSSGMILFQTSQIIHGGETNYIRATVTLYVSIYNLFVSLLHILGVMSDD
ncbi:Bax inhibitor-1/YccA family protein [Salinispirillum sp. LH 10-3-1]|uniref:Bax inhibitor-1/YccA family protein n=1 Tax=Salinispirillum sp. LH 10-3-1 TaxID=2952525 RepID=A0AB38YJX7_9GAMM